jgi:plastocyanin
MTRMSLLVAVTLSVMAVPATATDFSVMQIGKKFSVTVIDIRVGDRVTFVNADHANHNLYSETSGFEFDLGNQRPGQSAVVPFSSAGVVEVKCAIHPKMKLQVRVRR